MRRLLQSFFWLMDVLVAVFIGPIERNGARGEIVRQMAEKRSTYAFAFTGAMVLLITIYAIAVRWPSGSIQ